MSDEETCKNYIAERWKNLDKNSMVLLHPLGLDYILLLWEKQFWQHLAKQRKTEKRPELKVVS